jgi:protein gp37
VLDIRKQCIQNKVPFHFKQTGARFVKNGRLYRVKRHYQHSQAAKAAIDYFYVH